MTRGWTSSRGWEEFVPAVWWGSHRLAKDSLWIFEPSSRLSLAFQYRVRSDHPPRSIPRLMELPPGLARWKLRELLLQAHRPHQEQGMATKIKDWMKVLAILCLNRLTFLAEWSKSSSVRPRRCCNGVLEFFNRFWLSPRCSDLVLVMNSTLLAL